jgi:hypothetical protein
VSVRGTLSAWTDRARIKTRGCMMVFITHRKSGGWIRDQGEEDTCHVPGDEPLLVFIVALLLASRPGLGRCIASPVRAELVRRHRLTPVLTDRTANLAGHRGRRVGQGAGVPEVGVLLTGFARKLGFYRVTRRSPKTSACAKCERPCG